MDYFFILVRRDLRVAAAIELVSYSHRIKKMLRPRGFGAKRLLPLSVTQVVLVLVLAVVLVVLVGALLCRWRCPLQCRHSRLHQQQHQHQHLQQHLQQAGTVVIASYSRLEAQVGSFLSPPTQPPLSPLSPWFLPSHSPLDRTVVPKKE
jgi:hypothetical protein